MVQSWLELAHLRAEKGEISEAKAAYSMALQLARRKKDMTALMEAISGMLRMASESLDEAAIEKWDRELDRFISKNPHSVPALAWYCKAAVSQHQNRFRVAQRYLLNYLRQLRHEKQDPTKKEEAFVKGWVALAIAQYNRQKLDRADRLAARLIERFGPKEYRSLNGVLYMVRGRVAEERKQTQMAWKWYHEAHGSFLAEHNWYYHLYVLFAFARVHRQEQHFQQALQFLDLVSRAVKNPEFGLLRKQVQQEREKLQGDAIDLLIDSREGLIQRRNEAPISIGKQYVLLDILKVLSEAHHRSGPDADRGLSKAEIIEKVWKEPYRPKIHDNKLYYNINRLRKLLESDVHHPRYLLNWKEGYRLSPGLKVQFVGGAGALSNKGELA